MNVWYCVELVVWGERPPSSPDHHCHAAGGVRLVGQARPCTQKGGQCHENSAVLRIRDVYDSLSRIPDPTFFHPGSKFFPSQIRTFSIPDPGSTSKSLSIFTQKIVFKAIGNMIRFFYPSRVPDPGVKKAPDPGVKKALDPGSATLAFWRMDMFHAVSRIRNYLYRSGSDPSINKKKNIIIHLISTVLWLLNDLLCRKTDINVPTQE